MQTRRMSLFEVCVSVLIGYLVSVGVTLLVLPWFGYDVGVGESAVISIFFTVTSVIRGYCVRRVFERYRRLDFERYRL